MSYVVRDESQERDDRQDRAIKNTGRATGLLSFDKVQDK